MQIRAKAKVKSRSLRRNIFTTETPGTERRGEREKGRRGYYQCEHSTEIRWHQTRAAENGWLPLAASALLEFAINIGMATSPFPFSPSPFLPFFPPSVVKRASIFMRFDLENSPALDSPKRER